jgi:hypothetical protein
MLRRVTIPPFEIAEKEPVQMKLPCSGSAGFFKRRAFQFSVTLSGHSCLIFHV